MNENVSNIINCFMPSNEITIGKEMIYTEGIVKARVKIIDSRIKENMNEYDIEVIESLSKFAFPQKFTIGKKEGYEGW